jgi:murein hydrolase activator
MILIKRCFFLSIVSFIYVYSFGVFFYEVAFADEINTLLEKEKIELKKLKEEISKQTLILSKMGKKEYSNLKKQRILDGQLKIKKRELKIYDWNLKINKNKINDLSKKLALKEKQIFLQQKSMRKRIRMIYKEGNFFPVKMLFSSDDFVDLLNRTMYMEKVIAFDELVFSKYEHDLENFNIKKESLLHAKGDLLLYKNKAISKNKEILNEKKIKQQFLTKLINEKKINKLLRDELVQSSIQLNQLISRLEDKMIKGEGIDIIDKKGKLLPPVKGNFLNKFGRRKDKKYNTYIVSNGVNIEIKKDSPVRSVFNGKVLYTGTLEGYGNIIIIGHGKNYHSLYGHLDEFKTSSGRSVRSGQIIGRSGDTGSTLGESLYFEMRHNGNPIEPTSWLSKSNK